MARALTMLAAVALAVVAVSAPALADRQVYAYRVIHAIYGEIGTYTNAVEREGDETRVDSDLHVAVKILGIVFFRQEAQRSEYWRHDRLVSFDGVTVTNGDKLEIRGTARDGGFAITTPSGTVMAPAAIRPSNPWSAMVLNGDVVMSTRTGKVTRARVTGGEKEPVAFNGNTLRLHQYEIVGEKHEFVWLDDRGVTIAFRTQENGSAVDFFLIGES